MQLADDTNLITINVESMTEIINFFRKYEKASGTKINISKATITPLTNARIYNLRYKILNFKITKNKETFKLLGIQFSKDLHYANEYNWQECLQKN